MMRAVAFSDPKVIAKINASYVPYELNLTQESFPSEFAGLARWRRLYESERRYSRAFATSIILTSTGKSPVATSGWGHRSEEDVAVNYSGPRFLHYLDESLDRFQRLESLVQKGDREGLSRMREEIINSVRAANHPSE